ncbi:hypothetical protein ACUYFE_08005 [Olegusella massiliensis]|uniref:hypothetical protein n=1 Tax=Olegusella massiliensis TaxID=1776381 RepID=UPI0040558CF2
MGIYPRAKLALTGGWVGYLDALFLSPRITNQLTDAGDCTPWSLLAFVWLPLRPWQALQTAAVFAI